MMSKLLSFFCFCIVFTTIANSQVIAEKDVYLNGGKAVNLNTNKGYTGSITTYFNGPVQVEGSYVNGEKDGKFIYYKRSFKKKETHS